MKKTLLQSFMIVSLLGVVACSTDDGLKTQENPAVKNFERDTLSHDQIKNAIDAVNREGGEFAWSKGSNQLLWSAIISGNNLVSIGFGDNKDDFDKGNSLKAEKYRSEIIQIIQQNEGKSIDELLLYESEFLNIMDVKIEKRETFIALLNKKGIRYIEPADFHYFTASELNRSSGGGSGCGYNKETIAAADYTTVTPNAKVPWNFYKHNIPSAWNYSTGAGITIGVVDTGLSNEQSLMNASFNSGVSSGRTRYSYGVYVDSAWPWVTSPFDGANDLCGHGSNMSAVATAPRNNAGQPVGVAYNSNLIVYRASKNVVLDDYHEQLGVETAFTRLANNTNVKVISMSMGHILSVGRIEDAVKYAYGKGKFIVTAGGTSTTFTNFVGVIFPAWMPEVVAATGIKDNGYTECDVCHKGSKIDFAVVMEKATTGAHVPVLSYYNGYANYSGGSSIATATTAGMAALIWSKYPTYTRAQVLAKMKAASAYPTTRHANFGHGTVNVLKAVQ